jgi:hypothetical protein
MNDLACYDAELSESIGEYAPERTLAKASRFQDEDADFVCRRNAPWLVKGLWPRIGVCFVAGPSGSGKSFWVLEQISRIAKGQKVLGRRSVPSSSIYVAAEGANGVRARLEGLRLRSGAWGGQIRFVPDAPNLADNEDVAAFTKALLGIKEDIEKRGGHLGSIVVDTLSASMPGTDENSSKEMGSVLRVLQDLATKLEVCVIVVAHVGKEAERGIRGWSGQLANADGAITFYAPEEGGIRSGQVQKVKDGEAGERIAFCLEVIELGLDDDGDMVTTCVVAEMDTPPPRRTKKVKDKISPQAEMVLSAYRKLREEELPSPFPGSDDFDAVRVSLKALRTQTFDLGLHAEMLPQKDEGLAAMKRWQEARKKAFQRALDKLLETGRIVRDSDNVWVP